MEVEQIQFYRERLHAVMVAEFADFQSVVSVEVFADQQMKAFRLRVESSLAAVVGQVREVYCTAEIEAPADWLSHLTLTRGFRWLRYFRTPITRTIRKTESEEVKIFKSACPHLQMDSREKHFRYLVNPSGNSHE